MPAPQFEEMYPWEIARAIAEQPLGYLPLGTLEWHGEHSAVGLDSLKAHAVCIQAARISGGVESGERYHVPGNMYWLRSETYTSLLLDMYEAMRRRGLRAILVLSGHWSSGTLPIIRASGEAFMATHPDMRWLLLTDQEVLASEPAGSALFYPHEHAAGGEISLLMHLRPELVDLGKTFETGGALAEDYRAMPEHLQRRAETDYKYIGVLRGVEDDSNDPELSASPRRGQALLEAIAARVAGRALKLME